MAENHSMYYLDIYIYQCGSIYLTVDDLKKIIRFGPNCHLERRPAANIRKNTCKNKLSITSTLLSWKWHKHKNQPFSELCSRHCEALMDIYIYNNQVIIHTHTSVFMHNIHLAEVQILPLGTNKTKNEASVTNKLYKEIILFPCHYIY